MSQPDVRPINRTTSVVARILAGLVAAAACAVFVLTVWMVVRSRFGPPDQDPHGYVLIFGTVFGIFTGAIVVAVLPLVFPRGWWRRAYLIGPTIYGVVVIALIAMLVTA